MSAGRTVKMSFGVWACFSSAVKGGVCRCGCARARACLRVCERERERELVCTLLSHMSLSMFFLSFFFFVSFVCFLKTEMSCYGDWDAWIKGKSRKREMWLSGDARGPVCLRLTVWRPFILFSFLKNYSKNEMLTCADEPLPAAAVRSFVCWQGLSDWPVIIQHFQPLHHLIITLHRDSIARTRSW